ncbi:MAG: DUF4135 domain-containing protein [Corynebacterium sp.]|uniref:DUF4135 domain-containing protein n=1 Tax=Corynebacterium sp. TaxID=1720 RepID=UPI0026DB9115|nr:DUF4135 domain-containing protein [Corynebacterium sp.]MDO5098786.1 DUF4135 domain-containing protein [Corynebacterium sp.]
MNCEFPNYLDAKLTAFEQDLRRAFVRERFHPSDSVIADVKSWFASRATQISQRALIAVFHQWREKQGIEPFASSTQAHEEFDRLLQFEDQREKLVEAQYPRLKPLIDAVYSNSLEYTLQVFSDFEKDRQILQELGVGETDVIHSLRFHHEETHNQGKTTVLVTTNNGKVMYKPRSGKGEVLIDQVCRFLGTDPFELVAHTIDVDDHCWQQYIPSASEKNVDVDMKNYMTAAGTLLAACHILGATDLHADNVVCSVTGKPVVIDGETAIQFRIPDELPADASDILTSGLVPSALSDNSFWRYFSGLLIESERDSPEFDTFDVVNGGHDNVAFRRVVKPHLKKMPPNGLHDIDLTDAFQILIDSFASARSVARSSELAEFLAIAEQEHFWRQVLRSTGVYASILDATLMPAALAGLDRPEELLDSGPRGTDGAAIGVAERKQIAVADVPYFVLDFFGNVYDGNKHHCGKVRFSERLSLPSKRHADFVGEYGSAYIEVLKANAQALAAATGIRSSRPICVDELVDEVKARRTNLDESMDNRWLSSDIQEEGLFLGAFSCSFLMGDGTDWLMHDTLGFSNRAPEERWSVHIGQNLEEPMNFHGFGPGTALLVTHKTRPSTSAESERMHQVVEALTGALGKESVTSDFIGGVESAVAALGNLNVIIESETARLLYQEAREFLLPRMQASLSAENYGLAHGAAGTLLAAYGFSKFCQAQEFLLPEQVEQKMNLLADNLVAYALKLVQDEPVEKRLAWCNGLSGIIGTLAIVGELREDSHLVTAFVDLAFMELAKAQTHRQPLDVSLCHGVAGILSALWLLEEYGLIGEDVPVRYRDSIVKTLESSEIYCGYPGNIFDMGYLNGIGGLIHALQLVDAPTHRPLFAGF